MKRVVFSFFLFISCLHCFSQESAVIDSIKIKIGIATTDTQLVALLNDLAWDYSLTNYDSAEKYTDKAIELSEQLSALYWQAVSYEMKAILYEISGQQEEAIKLYLHVIDLREKMGGEGLENTYNNIAVLFKNQNNHQKALEYFEKSYKIELERNNKRGILASQMNMAISLSDLGMKDTSFALISKALDNARLCKDDEYEIYAIVNLTKRYYEMGELDSVLHLNLSVIDKARSMEMYGPLATILHMIADVYIERRQYESALKYLKEGEELATQINTLEFLRSNYHSQANAYAGLQAFAKSHEYLSKYIVVNDSLINRHTIEVLHDLEKKYETAKKDEKIARLNELNARTELKTLQQANLIRTVLLSAGLLFIVAILIVLMLRQRLKNQKLTEEVKAAEFRRKTSELEMKALRAQMNPHFIFNCMAAINKMVLNGESESASRYLNKFSKLIRLTLENSEHATITLEDELSILEAYIQLEAVRFKNKVSYEISVDTGIDTSSIEIPPMILQPFIENAIWHGLMHKKDAGHLDIKIREEGDELKCTIEDNGVGREMALKLTNKVPAKNKSMGLKITKERLQLINKNHLKDWIEIIDLKDTSDNPAGTRVTISLPIT